MIISQIGGGIGNQLYQYATGRRLAHKWNTELKFDISGYENAKWPYFALNCFNVKASIATPEEIARLKQNSLQLGVGQENKYSLFMPEVLNYPNNIWLHGYWQYEEYFIEIADTIRRELTLKIPLSEKAEQYKEKILNAECAASMHFRHGDFVYSPVARNMPTFFAIAPLEYYYKCVNTLKREYENLTLFIFSDDLQWAKENLRAGVPTEFVEGCEQDVEELYLMSLCKHNIISKSTFSWWGAWLNQNPDKKVFMPMLYSNGKKIDNRRQEVANENSPLDSDRWIRIPFDLSDQQSVTMRPWFSLLLVVNNDIDTLVESLNSIIGQDYKYFELIIIDNASTDDSGKICRQAKTLDNVTLIKLHTKVQNGAAWNIALKAAQGYYVMFLKGNDRLLANALTSLYLANEFIFVDIVNSVMYLKEDRLGNVDISGKKFVIKKMSAFQNLNSIFRDKLDKSTLLKILSNDEIPFPIETKIFSRKFLEKNKIRFNEKIGDDTENLFIIDALFQTEEIIFTPNIFYIAP